MNTKRTSGAARMSLTKWRSKEWSKPTEKTLRMEETKMEECATKMQTYSMFLIVLWLDVHIGILLWLWRCSQIKTPLFLSLIALCFQDVFLFDLPRQKHPSCRKLLMKHRVTRGFCQLTTSKNGPWAKVSNRGPSSSGNLHKIIPGDNDAPRWLSSTIPPVHNLS